MPSNDNKDSQKSNTHQIKRILHWFLEGNYVVWDGRQIEEQLVMPFLYGDLWQQMEFEHRRLFHMQVSWLHIKQPKRLNSISSPPLAFSITLEEESISGRKF